MPVLRASARLGTAWRRYWSGMPAARARASTGPSRLSGFWSTTTSSKRRSICSARDSTKRIGSATRSTVASTSETRISSASRSSRGPPLMPPSGTAGSAGQLAQPAQPLLGAPEAGARDRALEGALRIPQPQLAVLAQAHVGETTRDGGVVVAEGRDEVVDHPRAADAREPQPQVVV